MGVVLWEPTTKKVQNNTGHNHKWRLIIKLKRRSSKKSRGFQQILQNTTTMTSKDKAIKRSKVMQLNLSMEEQITTFNAMSIIGKSWTPEAKISKKQILMKRYMLTKVVIMKSSNLPVTIIMTNLLYTKTQIANLKDLCCKARANLLIWVGYKITKITQNWSKFQIQIKTTSNLKVSSHMLLVT